MTGIISGTVSVAGGTTAVSLWSGTPLNNINLPVGSQVVIEGVANFVAARINTTDFTLQIAHEGAGGAGLSCAVSANTPEEISIGKANRSLATAIEQISALDANGRGIFFNLISPTGDNDPGPGQMAMNNLDPTLVSEIYLDILDANTNQEDVSALIDLWATDTVVIIRSISTSGYVSLKLTGAPVVVAGYRKCSVAYVGHSGVLGTEPVAVDWNQTGSIGAPSGVNFVWNSSTADADPGLGNISANNATLSSATKIFVDDQAAGGANISVWVDSWDDSGGAIRGSVIIASKATPSTFHIFDVTGSVVDDGGYRDVTVSYVSGQGSFLANEELYVSFGRAGDPGADGTGVGDLVSTNNLSDVASASTSLANIGANDASNLTTGTLPDARVSTTLTAEKAFRRGNILAAVAQTSGIAMGGLIERGSNANGEYAKFADGTMLCGAKTTGYTGGTGKSGSWAAGFASIDGIGHGIIPYDGWDYNTQVYAHVNSWNFICDTTRVNNEVQFVALGRWFL